MRRGALVSVAVSAGLLLLVWATVTGPVLIIGSSGRHAPPDRAPGATAAPTPIVGSNLGPSGDPSRIYDLSWLGSLLMWTLVAVLVLLALFGASRLWPARWRPPERPVDEDFEVLPDVTGLTRALSEDADAQLEALLHGAPRNGIVRCWLRLEELISDAGLPRAPWETSAEFTLRVLHTLDVDPRAIGSLGGLYREARFSEHTLGEDSRTAARGALLQIHRYLSALGLAEPGPAL